jgi:hypothetical protein
MDVKHPWSGVCRRVSIVVGNAIKNDFAADAIPANVELISDARIYNVRLAPNGHRPRTEQVHGNGRRSLEFRNNADARTAKSKA